MDESESRESASSKVTEKQQNSSSVTLNAFSRVTASVGLMLLFGIGGGWLDRWLGVGYLTIIGFLVGGTFMLVGMLYSVKAAEFERKQLDQKRNTRE
ncbi:hypothetical protein SH449x_002099 [Pirellulaceae bacterium SH449]